MKKLSLPHHWTHRHYDSVASTMLLCRPEHLEPGSVMLVSADEQTAGRGQRGTSWESAKGLNLTFNIGWRTPEGPWPAANEQFLISEVTALAVARTLQDFLPPELGARVSVKWPNDVYVGDRKACGMLLEHQLSGKRIVTSMAGIGINVNQPAFVGDAPNPVSLRQLLGHDVEREAVLEAFVGHFTSGIHQLEAGRYDEVERQFASMLYRRTGQHPFRDAEGEFAGEFVGIARNGLLTLRKSDGTVREYAFKEVTFVVG